MTFASICALLTPLLIAFVGFLINTYDVKHQRSIVKETVSAISYCQHDNLEPVRNVLTLELVNVICTDCNQEVSIDLYEKRVTAELDALDKPVTKFTYNDKLIEEFIYNDDYLNDDDDYLTAPPLCDVCGAHFITQHCPLD